MAEDMERRQSRQFSRAEVASALQDDDPELKANSPQLILPSTVGLTVTVKDDEEHDIPTRDAADSGGLKVADVFLMKLCDKEKGKLNVNCLSY